MLDNVKQLPYFPTEHEPNYKFQMQDEETKINDNPQESDKNDAKSAAQYQAGMFLFPHIINFTFIIRINTCIHLYSQPSFTKYFRKGIGQ